MMMVRYIESVFEQSVEFLTKWSYPMFRIFLVVFFLSAALALALYKIDRNALTGVLNNLRTGMRKAGSWLLLIFSIFLLMNLLVAVRMGVIQKIETARSAQYSTEDDSGGGRTVQYAPSVAFEEIITREQKLFIPENTVNLINNYGVNYVPGWAPGSLARDRRPVISYEDKFEAEGKNGVIKRLITFRQFVPMKFDDAEIGLKLDFKDGGRGAGKKYYDAGFKGKYSFSNPFDEEKFVHFIFPLPYASGTLTDYKVMVNGKEADMQGINYEYIWEQTLKPREKVDLVVQYSNRGNTSWTYSLSSRRQHIKNFRMKVESNNGLIKFERGSLYPSGTTRNISGVSLEWAPDNIITSQNISLYFPGISITEIITRMYIFSPLALTGFIIMLIAWSGIKGFEISAIRLVFISFIYGGGYALCAYLLSSMPLFHAAFISFALVFVLCHMTLDKNAIPIAGIFSLLPFTFVWTGRTGILLCILGFICLALFAGSIKTRAYRTKENQKPADEEIMEKEQA